MSNNRAVHQLKNKQLAVVAWLLCLKKKKKDTGLLVEIIFKMSLD